jgi:hypothetical protein
MAVISAKLGTAFHESFPLSRPQMGQVLRALAEADQALDMSSATQRQEYLRNASHLGANQVKAVPNYALGAGLVVSNFSLTDFGLEVLANDPLLDKTATQWLMHYYLSAPHGPGPVFWNEVTTNYFRSGDEIAGEIIANRISAVAAREKGRDLASRTIKDTTTVFLGTYLHGDALGNLGILEDLGDFRYLVLDPEPPSAWVFGVALLDYWQGQFGDRLTINLSDLFASGGLGDLFLVGARQIDEYLSQLQTEGYVDVYRVAHPYQVVLLRQDAQPLLKKLYELEDTF